MAQDKLEPVAEERGEQIDRSIAQRFWEGQAVNARDPRSVTLDRVPSFLSRFEVSLYQGWLLRRLRELQAVRGKCVDIGCGNGQWTEVLARISSELWACDFSLGFVEECRRRMAEAGLADLVTVVHADAASLTLPSNVDLVVVGGVVQYLGDAEVDALLAQIRAACQPARGLIYVRTTVSRTGSTHVRRTASFQGIYRPIEWYDDRLAAAGFEVLRRSTASDFVPEELAARTARFLHGPIRAVWRAARWRKKTDVAAFIAQPRGRAR